ncbi:Ig-like domain-containing protein [Herpetosiphon gulosus]|uniref:Cadherin-like domain-containing protein n=1 Tax=Herpetosiphon gulosus TaxID=1973496 RepID=A0ABP9WW64_9CHLR
MPKPSNIIGLLAIFVLLFGAVQKPVMPVAAVEPQTPSSPGSWSQAFADPLKFDPGYIPLRPIEWNGTLYAGIVGRDGFDPGVGYWSGQQWLKLDGLRGEVDSLVVHQNRLFVAGRLTLGGKQISIAFWDGNLWTALPLQFSLNVFVLASHNDQLYIGGYSEQINDQPSGLVFRWDGAQLHSVAEGIYGAVFSMLSRPDGLYLGGTFSLNGQRTSLIHWNGAEWQSVGGGVYGIVMDVEWANDQLYISGQFTSTLEPTMKNVAAWNGTSWNTFGTGIVSPTHNLAMLDGDLYALSRTSRPFPYTPIFHLQRWDATHWTTLSNASGNNLLLNWSRFPDVVLVNYQQELFAFGTIGFVDRNEQTLRWGDSALRWRGDRWEAMTPNGISTMELALAVDGEDVYAASSRMVWGNGHASLAHLTPNNQWQLLIAYESQQQQYAQALQKYQQSFFSIDSNKLYQVVNNAWVRIGSALVNSLAQANNLLYVAGNFEQFNGVTAHNLVTWDGSQWQALNTPASFDQVVIVEAYGNNVYISDGFQLARWDGSQWTTLATNVVNIGEVEPTANGVYIAGTFSSVGGVTASKIAYWNGTAWSGLTGEIDGSIYDLETGADGLYVAGWFRGIINGIYSPGILRWDGTAWHGLEGGVRSSATPNQPGSVSSLAATPTRMLMYGSFDRVGNTYESNQIAAWEYGNEPLIQAKPDYGSTYRAQPVVVDVIANDWSDQPNRLQLVNVSSSSHGTAVINGNSVVYTPETEFQGVETLSYTVRDPINAVTTTAQLRVQVWNHFPTIADQEQTIYPFVETLLDPLDGLIDLNGDALTITQASAVSGTVTIVNNQLRYMPPNQEHLTDLVTYTVSDGHGGQQTARIKLHSIDAVVVAVDDVATTYRPHAVNVAVLANDWSLNNEPIQLIAVSAASHGTATISGNQVRYVPIASFQGIETLEYTVRNPTRGVTATGILTIEVQNHAPTVAPMTITIKPNSITVVDVLAHVSDLNGDPVAISLASAAPGMVAVVNNQLRYTAPNYYPFAATISYTVGDDHGGSQVGTIVVNSAKYQLFLPYTSK